MHVAAENGISARLVLGSALSDPLNLTPAWMCWPMRVWLPSWRKGPAITARVPRPSARRSRMWLDGSADRHFRGRLG